MIRINLLPYREELRAQRKRRMMMALALAAVAGAAVAILVHGILAGRIDHQQSRNDFLNGEIAKLDKQIKEIKDIKDQTEVLLEKKRVVESLQTNRSDAVHIMDQLLRQLPEGVYLKSVKQSGESIGIVGYAQSNARVSTLMRNLDASPWLENPNLVEIKAVTIDKARVNEFNLSVKLERQKVEETPADKSRTAKQRKNT